MTLPDVYAKRYGRTVEIMVALYCLTSFVFLLAGNLLGLGIIIDYVWGLDRETSIWTASALVWIYTVSGGLFSVAYTDVMQGLIGWIGCFVCAIYIIHTEPHKAPPPSIGYAGYTYPDAIGEGGICDMYKGVSCENDTSKCCYNAALWCPSDDDCRADNGAYPFGDQRTFDNQMFDSGALSPFPNAIMVR
jgi:Sodium:solute symporter family